MLNRIIKYCFISLMVLNICACNHSTEEGEGECKEVLEKNVFLYGMNHCEFKYIIIKKKSPMVHLVYFDDEDAAVQSCLRKADFEELDASLDYRYKRLSDDLLTRGCSITQLLED